MFPPTAIVAFTFTERAAEELKNRIERRVEERLGRAALDRLGGLFVGTIHAYCFRLLQQHVPRYETYDVLDDNQLTAFLSREASRLAVRQLDPANRLFASIAAFLQSVDVVENELLDPATMPEPFGSVLRSYYDTLERYRLLTYGQQVVRAVRELERPELAGEIHGELRHLIVDEYQDVNPAQERLIELLTGSGGRAVRRRRRRSGDLSVARLGRLATSSPSPTATRRSRRSRSRPTAAADRRSSTIANRFAHHDPGSARQDDAVSPQSERWRAEPEVVVWQRDSEVEEAGWIASLILDLDETGVPYQDIAVLVRSRAAYTRLVEQFATFDIPVQPGGRSGLFDQPEAVVLGHTIAWLTDIEWRDRYGPARAITDAALFDEYQRVFDAVRAAAQPARRASCASGRRRCRAGPRRRPRGRAVRAAR